MAEENAFKIKVQRRTTMKRMTTTLMNRIERDAGYQITPIAKIKEYIEQLEAKEKQLYVLEEEIINLSLDETTIDADTEVAENYRENIIRTKCIAREFIEERNLPTIGGTEEDTERRSNSSESTVRRPAIKLPKLVIEKFMGDPSLWNGFWSQFEIAVHNTTDDDVTKFGYLKSYLGGKAAGAIAGLALTRLNYIKAVEKLKARFGRTQLIKSAHMNNLLSFEPVKRNSDFQGLRSLYDRIEVQIRSLESLGIPSSTYDAMLIPLLRSLIPDEMAYEFDRKHPDDDDYCADDMLEFIRQEIEGKERHAILTNSWRTAEQKKQPSTQNYQQDRVRTRTNKPEYGKGSRIPSTAVLQVSATPSKELECIFCEKTTHKTKDCTAYSAIQRKNILKKKARCFICMQYKHRARDCKAELSCSVCSKRHDIAVCESKFPEKNTEDEPAVVSQNCAPIEEEANVYLKTADVHAIKEDKVTKLRLLIDDGSQRTFVREDISRRLKLPVIGIENVKIFAFESNVPTLVTRKRVRLILRDVETQNELTIEALESPYLCAGTLKVPSRRLKEEVRSRGMRLADENIESKKIDLLIGSEYYWMVVTGKIELLTETLAAVETLFGWTIHGFDKGSSYNAIVNSVAVLSNFSQASEEELASNQLKKFWDLEGIGIRDLSIDTVIEDKAMTVFNSTVKFKNNRYEVTLPWRDNIKLTSQNYVNAKNRFESLKKRFVNDPDLYLQYSEVINEYLRHGIAERVLEREGTNGYTFYLPHHPVIRRNRTSTKLRVVFDGSAREANSPSLNDCLYAGESINTDLLKQLLTFRLKPVAFTADIEKAFLQISLANSDRDAVRFFWTEDPNGDGEPIVLRMTRVLFGVSSSPFLLASTIRHHIENFKESHPEAYELLREYLYVDDLTGGADDDETALKVTLDSKKIMQQASMNLCKWKTNSRKLRKDWGEDMKGREDSEDENEGFSPLKVLGIKWNPQEDVIQFDASALIEFLAERKDTKRFVLRASSRIFDPVGYLAPFIIRVKCLFQEIWEMGVAWDEILPPELNEKWKKWCEELPALNEVSIPRYYFDEAEDGVIQNLELHCFSDSSEKAYGAALYLKFKTRDGRIATKLVTSKSRVAPLKKLTLPRLELMGAVIAVRLMNHTKEYFAKMNPKLFYWTDSTITLSWIKGSANKWKPFVANRVREIQLGSDPSSWAHCPGRYNPADLITRGLKLTDLVQNTRWWTGPEFLRSEGEERKLPDDVSTNEDVSHEVRSKYDEIFQAPCTLDPNEPIFKLEDRSRLSKVLRTTAWIMRFISNSRGKEEKLEGSLTSEELRKAEVYWIKRSQYETFLPELQTIKAEKTLPKESKIATLSPFVDDEGALRVGGRLKLAEFSYAERHPYILPEKHYLAKLQIMEHHERTMHGGLSATLTSLREQYWVVRGRQVAKAVIGKCLTCKKYNAKPPVVATAPLPRKRMIESRAFDVTGIDFAGPVYVKIDDKSEKSYIALFTCATTRAIHLELVTSLSSEKFLLALKRFIARRGLCSEIQSDNAKTFKRAEKDLEELWKFSKAPIVMDYVGQERIKWTYIVERASWWGGYWERLVRSVKTALRKTLGKTSLTFEEFITTLAETEAVLNSRPLSYVMNEKDEPSPLTPADFLIGRKLTPLLTRSYTMVQLTRSDLTRRLKYRQSLLESFWKRWRKEYLLELRSVHRSQIIKGTKEIKKNDVVLITEDKSPRAMWKLGRITEVFYGRDGLVRSCALTTPNGNVIKRPVQLLRNLEVNE